MSALDDQGHLRSDKQAPRVYTRRRIIFLHRLSIFHVHVNFLRHRNISRSCGGRVSFLGADEKKGWSKPMWSIVMWILLSRLGCWMNKCGSLCPDFCVLYFLAYVLLSMRSSFSALHADQVEDRLHLQTLWITYLVQISLARRIITDALGSVVVRLCAAAGKEGAISVIWTLDPVFRTLWLSWFGEPESGCAGSEDECDSSLASRWWSATLCPERGPKLVSGLFRGETSISCSARCQLCSQSHRSKMCCSPGNPKSLGVFTFSVTAECSVTSHRYLCLW